MKFPEYLASLPRTKKMSDVKVAILNRLWGEDNLQFPRPWVSSKELLELTNQKYFDRRARELRDQIGCDIESQYKEEFAGHAWRINSNNLKEPQNRDYLSQRQKNQLFEKSSNSCSICGRFTDPGIRGLQADHRVPVSRGGTNEIDNWQALCNHCNVGKRRTCEDCNLDCNNCSWAYPETVGISTMVSLGLNTLVKITEYSKKTDQSISQVIEEAAIKYLV